MISFIYKLSKLAIAYQRLFSLARTASTNTIFPTVDWRQLSNTFLKANLCSNRSWLTNREPFSPKAASGKRQPTSNVLVRTGTLFGSHCLYSSINNLTQLTGKLLNEYAQPVNQNATVLPGQTQLRESIPQAELTAQWALMLTGCALLLGVGYVVYTRQQRIIRLLTRQKAEIVRQVQHLELINQKKTSLFSLISHDLRLPIIRLKQQLHTLKLTSPNTALVSQQIRESEEQVDQLARMLTNLLDWSVVQMKRLPTNPKPVDLSMITIEVIADVSAQLKQKEIRLINQVSESTWIIADRYQLLCVIRNLVSNAIKFTPPHGYVRLYAKTAEDMYTWLTVRDTGIGMSADQVACVLSAPIIRSGTKGEPGTGLGLLLCQELLGSDPSVLQLTSQPEKGTAVTIRLTTVDEPVC